jgi:UDPglucose 6-dehydrogenase
MNILVVGSGYVGLISGVCLASRGHNVVCVDKNKQIVSQINNSKPTIFEKNLEEVLAKVVKSGNFKAVDNLEYYLNKTDIVLICVGTPNENGSIDLTQIKDCIEQIAKWISFNNHYLSIVIKSTVLPTTTDTLIKDLIEKISSKKLGQFGLGMNPEFLREGNAMEDFMKPDRIVIGYDDETTKNKLTEMYKSWDVDKLYVSTRTAEMIKYSNNSILASQISMVNELANLAAKIGNIDILEVIEGVITDKRWNPINSNLKRVNPEILSYLIPGCGFGGSCFPKDVNAIKTMGLLYGLDMKILKAVLEVNASQPSKVIETIKNKYNLKNKNVLVLGLSFKPDTDDVRESVSYKIIRGLKDEMSLVWAHDPIAIENFSKCYPDLNYVNYSNEWISIIEKMDIIIVATKWSEYKEVASHLSKNQIIFDARRMFDKKLFANYMSFGLS